MRKMRKSVKTRKHNTVSIRAVTMVLITSLLLLSAAGCSGNGADEEIYKIDIDFTQLSTTVAVAEYGNIMTQPRDYLGQTFKVSGLFFSEPVAEFDRYFHYITVWQGDSCCPPSVFEIKLAGDNITDDDYPKQRVMIEVTGVLSKYEEQGWQIVYLAVDELTVL